MKKDLIFLLLTVSLVPRHLLKLYEINTQMSNLCSRLKGRLGSVTASSFLEIKVERAAPVWIDQITSKNTGPQDANLNFAITVNVSTEKWFEIHTTEVRFAKANHMSHLSLGCQRS